MQIIQGDFREVSFTVLNADAPYNSTECLTAHKFADATKWEQFSVAPFFYPDGVNENMDGKIVAKWQGDGHLLQVVSDGVTMLKDQIIKIKTHNPMPWAEVVHCFTEKQDGTSWIRVEDDEHLIPAFESYEGNFKTTEDGLFRFGVELLDGDQYRDTLYGISQFIVYTGSIIDSGIINCKILEAIDYDTYKSNSVDITGVGQCNIDKTEPFRIYDDQGRPYGEWFVYQIKNLSDNTWELVAYDRAYKLARKVSRGDWFEGHTAMDAVKNVFTYTDEYEWRTENGNTEMEKFIEVDDEKELRGLIPWSFNLRQTIQQIALALCSYAYTDRDGKTRFKSLEITDSPDHELTDAQEIYGRRVTEPDKTVDMVTFREYGVKWTSNSSGDKYMRRYKAETWRDDFNASYNEGIYYHRYNNIDEEIYWKYFGKVNGEWYNYRSIGTGYQYFEQSLDKCPSPRPSDSQHFYYKQTAEWTTAEYLILTGERYCEGGAIQDVWQNYYSFPEGGLSPDTDFYNDNSIKNLDCRLTCSEVSGSRIVKAVYDNFHNYYTVSTQLLPNYDIQVGDTISLSNGEHIGRVMSVVTDLSKGGLIDVEIQCHQPTN